MNVEQKPVVVAPPPDQSTQISTTVTILRKRPCPVSTTPNASLKRPLRPLYEVLNQLETDVVEVQNRHQQAALQRVIEALDSPCPRGQFPAVCLDTGTSAAAGDSSSFDAVIHHIRSHFGENDISVISLHPSRHDSLRATAEALSIHNENDNQRVVVAVELAHLFHPDLLSDLVYLLSHKSISLKHQHGKDKKDLAPPVSAVFAIPHANALHECLNVGDAATLRTTLVRMPTQHEGFDGVIEALSSRKGIIFATSTFHIIRDHFLKQDTSLSTVMRTLRQMITLHFNNVSTARFIPIMDGIDKNVSSAENIKSCLHQILDNPSILGMVGALPSVRSVPNGTFSDNDDEDRVRQYVSCIQALIQWKRDVSALNELAYALETQLFHSISSNNGYDGISSVRSNIFASFLPPDRNNNSRSPIPGASCLATATKFTRTNPKPEIRRLLLIILEHADNLDDSESENGLDVNNASTSSRAKALLAQIDSLSHSSSGIVSSTDNHTQPTEMTNDHQNRTNGTPAPIPASPSSLLNSPSLNVSTPKRHAKGAGAAQQRRHELLNASATKAKQKSPLNTVREETTKLIHSIFSRVKPLRSLTCHEILLFEDTKALQLTGGGLCSGIQPRSTILNALRAPSRSLLHSDVGIDVYCKSNDDVRMADENEKQLNEIDVPDISVAFRILAQGGRLVSLYDWYNVFASTRAAAYIAAGEDNVSTAEMQARFARACSELEFIGLLKYTNRKTDHVARIVFE